MRFALVLALSACLSWAAAAQTPPPRSVSLRNASDGYLQHGKELPQQGKHHRVMKKTRHTGQHWGSDELLAFILGAAQSVAKHNPGRVLVIGNMSKKGGGDLPGSVSHNSGRDVDIPFFALDKRGKAVTSDDFVRFNKQGRAGNLRFDAAANWSLVAAALGDKRVQVQWMFVATPLRELMLAHAKKMGAPAALVARAEDVLGQPGNSSAHAEHFHVRLYCALHERLQGCLNYGPTHAWVNDYAAEVSAEAKRLSARFTHKDPARAIAAIDKVGAIRGHTAVPALARALTDTRTDVRTAVLRALSLLDGAEVAVPDLLAALVVANGDPWRAQLLTALAAIGDPRAAPAFIESAADSDVSEAVRLAAIRGLDALVWVKAVPTLVELLSSQPRAIRRAAAATLHKITNRRMGRGKRAVRRWRRWWKRHHHRDRLIWVRDGFKRHHRIRIERNEARAIKQLVSLIADGGAAAFNARALIRDRRGFFVERAHFSDRQLFRFYTTWLREGMPKSDAKR